MVPEDAPQRCLPWSSPAVPEGKRHKSEELIEKKKSKHHGRDGEKKWCSDIPKIRPCRAQAVADAVGLTVEAVLRSDNHRRLVHVPLVP